MTSEFFVTDFCCLHNFGLFFITATLFSILLKGLERRKQGSIHNIKPKGHHNGTVVWTV